MFDIGDRPPSAESSAPPADPPRPPGPGELPLERLEAEICTLAGHLAAATCRWLLLVAEFDRREGWLSWGQSSCAAWLSWKCGVSLTTAHDHVRVARALPGLAGVREAFAAGRLSFAKVRALTRIADAANEQRWLEVAASATAAQLDRLVAACRAATRADAAARVSREKLAWRYDDDGTVVITARLAPERGQRVVSALEHLQHLAAEQDRTPFPDSSAEATAGHGHDHGRDHGRGRGGEDEDPVRPGCSPVQALVRMADLARAHADKPVDTADGCQVVIHIHQTETGDQTGAGDRSEAEQAEQAEGPCHLDDGPALHPATARQAACEGATRISMRHRSDGTPLDAGRSTRKVPAALRRAVLDRAGGRCQYPGCSRRAWLEIHHVIHWLDGGRTDYVNLCALCWAHHTSHHNGKFQITHDTAAPGHFRFYRADGAPIPHAPQPPRLTGNITACHTAIITPEGLQSAHYDPLRLHYATSVMLS